MRRPEINSSVHHMEKAFEVLGMSLKNAEEFSAANLAAFNLVA
jgi:hypothetical protein